MISKLEANAGTFMLAMVVASSGCGGGDEMPPNLHRVTGTVEVDGKPAARVYVRFHAIEESGPRAPDGCKTTDDGSFSLMVHGTGDYAVTALWPDVTILDGEEIEGADRFGGRYGDPSKPIRRFMVVDGPNELPKISLQGS